LIERRKSTLLAFQPEKTLIRRKDIDAYFDNNLKRLKEVKKAQN
jgi:hypothetical protein